MEDQSDRIANDYAHEEFYVHARIKKIEEENYRVKTFVLDAKIDTKPAAAPGQFIMVWIPGIGERPFSLLSGKPVSISVANVGNVSEALHKLKQGETISFRGPYGNGFEFAGCKTRDSKLLLVAGGYGVVPLYFLAKEAKAKKLKITVIIGARNKKDIIFEERFRKLGADVIVATDDGSAGFRGNAVDAAKKQGRDGLKNFDCVYSCGPEKMMYFLAIACRDAEVPCQLSLERYMKCGLGICGSCDLNGMIVCRDGPVFEGEKALSFSEFGKTKRNGAGKTERI